MACQRKQMRKRSRNIITHKLKAIACLRMGRGKDAQGETVCMSTFTKPRQPRPEITSTFFEETRGVALR